MDQLFFEKSDNLLRTTIIGVLAYVSLIVLLRLSGPRTLSKMNAFDLVVTVALGSTLATILLNKSVTLAQGTLALALLVGMQFLVTWSSVRAQWIRRIVTGEPSMLLYRGALLPAAMRKARVTEDELRAAVRSSGSVNLKNIHAVVLETDGSFSVLTDEPQRGGTSLAGVEVPAKRAAD